MNRVKGPGQRKRTYWEVNKQYRVEEPGRRERPHTSSTQPPSLHDGNLARDNWWNLLRANQSVSEGEV
jgi:hypothetical protein